MKPQRMGHPVGVGVEWEVERPGKHPQAIWFARRGYVVLVVVRKGYGRSSGDQDGKHGVCQRMGGGSFVEAGEASAAL